MSRKAGLPQSVKMRHDVHFVDQLTSRRGSSIGRMIPVEQINPNPNQPRQQMGDLSELTASIREKGILEPLIVRKRQQGFEIISGERRYQASIQAGLTELPCVERDVDDRETVEIALVENIQRKDLTPFEEAEALWHLTESYDYTHDQLAKRIGRARTSITEMLTIHGMPEEAKNLCRLADINSKSLLLQIVRQGSLEKMLAMIDQISRKGLNREQARDLRRSARPGRPKNFVFKYATPNSPFRLQMTFRKSEVEKTEIVKALKAILADLERT